MDAGQREDGRRKRSNARKMYKEKRITKVASKIQSLSARCPFSIRDATLNFQKSKLLISFCKI